MLLVALSLIDKDDASRHTTPGKSVSGEDGKSGGHVLGMPPGIIGCNAVHLYADTAGEYAAHVPVAAGEIGDHPAKEVLANT